MRTTGSTMSRFDKHRAVKSSGMPHSRRDNAVRGNPAAHKNTNRPDGRFLFCVGTKIFDFFCVFLVQLWVNPVGTLVGGVINNYGDKV